MKYYSSIQKQFLRRDFFFALVSLIFFLSGCSALIYQVVWQRALTLYYGVGSVSTAVIVSVFLFGLGVGSVLGGFLAERSNKLLRFYILIEGVLGLIGLMSLISLKWMIPYLVNASYSQGFWVIAGMFALPTTLMGMTLPVVVKILNDTYKDFGKTISWLYFVNTLGASAGALVAAYWLISWYGLEITVYAASILNFALVVLVSGLTLLKNSNVSVAAPFASGRMNYTSSFNSINTFLIVFSTGFLAIGYQILSFRFIGTLLKSSAYVFATILGVYLLGIALGSYGFNRWLRLSKCRNLKNVFYSINSAIALYMLLLFITIFHADGSVRWMLETSFAEQLHPPYNIKYAIKGDTWPEILTSVYLLVDLLVWPLIILIPITLLMGASFPLVNILSVQNPDKDAFTAGIVYGLTILGNVLGALVTSFWLLPNYGTEKTLFIFIVCGLTWILGICIPKQFTYGKAVQYSLWIGLLMGAWAFLPDKHSLYDQLHPSFKEDTRVVTEGRDGVVVSMLGHKEEQDFVKVYIGGAIHATFPSEAFEVEVLEAFTHSKSIDNVLIIGFGGGTITQAVLRNPDVKSVTVVEISETLLDNLSQHDIYKSILSDPRLTIVIDDGRRFLQRKPHQYDMIFMDPLRSTTAYSNNLYSYEFFMLVSEHLTENGVLMTWMNEYSIIPKTMATAFRGLECFYYFCLGSNKPLAANADVKRSLLEKIEPIMRKKVEGRMSVEYYYKGNRQEILKINERYPINEDLNPITEYYIGYTQKEF
ncbi:fused MFS/spermidine synthase [Thalassospira australica]|uniref:fused MFS/spermidine synthase n=1 Tax=Thalassospira australica TaxID=1528106 RepID=UPI00051A58A6|nr:fused MFS/spermidine synthase [Thalassospira australica]